MANREVQRGVVKPPNEAGFKRDCRANGFLPLAGAHGGIPTEPNMSRFMHGDPGGSANLARLAPEIRATPNDTRFVDGDKGLTDQPPSAVSPGSGAVPVNPFTSTGSIVGALRQPDDAKTYNAK